MTKKIDIQIPIAAELNAKKRSTTACLFNLVIYGSETRRIKYLQDLVNSILDKFPCRLIFIQGDRESTSSYFRVKASNVPSGQIQCDQLVIETSQDQLFRVPFLITPNIVPDLPVYLLWGQNPFEERDIFPHLQKYAKRVIFDSECADNLKLFCKEMQTNLDTLKMDVMDINWALVSNWRDVLVEVFDTPEKIQHLYDCKSLIIKYNECKTETALHPEARALYLQGWLASALGWTYQTTEHFYDDTVISYMGTVHPAIVGLSPQHVPSLPLGAILSMELTTADQQTYYICRKENVQQVEVHISSRDTCELPFTLSLPNIHRGLSFMREIFFNALGNHYRDTLKNIAKIDLNTFIQR
jgi:glucose-6-phosphate dehydrogenase assembly protein OpcA